MNYFCLFPLLQADLMDTDHLKDVPVANRASHDVVMYYGGNDHDTNATEADDEPAYARCFQPYQDVNLNKPEGQFLMKQILDGDHAHAQSQINGGRERKGESQTNTVAELTDKEGKKVESDTTEAEIKHHEGGYIGVQSNPHEENCDHSFILKEDIGYVCHVCGVIERAIESLSKFQHAKSSTCTKAYNDEGQSNKSGDTAGMTIIGVKSPGNFSMGQFLANKLTQVDEDERNFGAHNTSAFSTDMVFKSRHDLCNWVQKVGRSLGYVIVTKRSKTNASGVTSTVFLKCDRGGTYKSKSSIRNRVSKKTNCQFELVGKYLKMHNIWTLRVICDKHNHEPTLHMEGHPYAKRLSTNETHLVSDLVRKNVKPQAILSTLKEKYKNNVSNIKTIYNARHKLRRIQHPETVTKQVISSDERASPCLMDRDPFATRYCMQELDSDKYGPATKDTKDLLLSTKQMLMSSFTRFPSLQADLMDTNHAKDVPIANPVRHDVVMYYAGNDHVTNATDADNSTRPFQLYQGVYVNKPEGEFLVKNIMNGGHAYAQSQIGKSGGEREREDESQTDTAVELTDKEDKKVDSDAETKIKNDTGGYVGIQSKIEMKEMCDHSFIFEKDIGYVCHVCGVVERGIEHSFEFLRPKISKSTKTCYYEGQCDKSGDTAGMVLEGVKSPGNDFSMDDFLTNKSTQGDETEENFGFHNTSAFSTDMVFKTRQDLFDWVQKVERSLGYVIVTKRSRTHASGVMSKVFLKCDRGGTYKSKSSSLRKSATKKTNCPFEVVGKYLKMYDIWTLRVICGEHNHEPSLRMEGHPYAMRLSANENRLVFDLSRKNVKPQAILSALKEHNKNNVSTLKTIYNARQKFRRIQRVNADLMDTNHVNDVSIANPERDLTDSGECVGIEFNSDVEEDDSQHDVNFDGLADIWKEMTVGLESSKDTEMVLSINQHAKKDEECDHSFILKEDIGYVCRVCGVVQRSIESIIEFQRPKSSKSRKTYYNEGQSDKSRDTAGIFLDGEKLPVNCFSVVDIYAHPRHKKQMKPHQIEGFNFLLSNLLSDNPGGCILAHAPGSGKTFMLISFIQSFMAKYPDSRPLVVLPRGILATWKKEFKRWQVEDIPLFDFYSQKADNRAQQLVVLKEWVNTRSILFLGYKQFSTIVCDNDRSSVASTCQEILLLFPTLVILDEGHTPRNKDTDVFTAIEKVHTPRKVVLSGTLYQNHVREVFNILNLVRPGFLKMEDSKTVKRRILSRVLIETRKNLFKKSTDTFCELVEHTLLKDDNLKRKVTLIEDLREMTRNVLQYYKGDFLDELPGHVDFSVFLNLSPRQKYEVCELKRLTRKFKVSSDGSAIYVHPDLKSLVKTITQDKNDDDAIKIDEVLEKLDEREGVKAKFFLNLLRLCTYTGEKLLVFGQYLLPLKFLLRLTMKVKGWRLNKEIFMITGNHDNEEREVAMGQFNNSSDAKVFFGSIKACGEGISLVGASRIIILDVHLNPSVTRQAIGRAFRPGQVRKVYTYRLVAAGSPEEEDHTTCHRKESIAKMWFEYNAYCGQNEFEMERTKIKVCGDHFLENPLLNEDVTALYKRC
ncbi:hypothetical protein R6Q57_025755 [Mikania cordata]